MLFRTLRVLLPCLFAGALAIGAAGIARAHGHTHVGDYELVIGFMNEPAYQGEPNGLDLRVTNTTTGEPVTGLEETLHAEILRGGAVQELPLRPRWGLEGAYTADVVPTEAGDYTWRIVGMIETTPVDLSMTSGPDTFSPVEPKAAVAFPAPEATPAELQEQAAAAAQLAQVALGVAALGAICGVAGLALAMQSRRARGRPAVVERSAAREA